MTTQSLDPGPGGETRKKRATGAEVCAHFKKVLNGYRLYAPGHSTRSELEKILYEALAAWRATWGELVLGVSPTSFLIDEHPVMKDEGRDTPICKCLFLDGIQRITFLDDLTTDELRRFMEVWATAFDGTQDGIRSLASRFWEEEFQAIRMVTVETFSEGADGDPKKSEDAEQRRSDEIQVLMSEISNERLADFEALDARPKLLRITADDLLLLRDASVSDLSAEDLARQDRAQRSGLSGADASDILELTAELSRPLDDVIPRAFEAILDLARYAHPEELDRLEVIARESLLAAIDVGRVADLSQIFEITERIRSSGSNSNLRPDIVNRFTATLEMPEVLAPIVALLDDPESKDTVARSLRLLRRESAGALLERLAAIDSADARRQLSEVIASMRPSQEELVAHLESAEASVVDDLLFISDQYPESVRDAVRIAAMNHFDAKVRRNVLSSMSKQQALDMRPMLERALADEDAVVRRLALNIFLSTKDQSVVPVLVSRLQAENVESTEKRAVLVALGALRGDAASRAIREHLARERDGELRGVAMLSLVHAEGLAARELIQGLKKLVWLNRKEKTMWQEALRRLDGMSAPSVPSVGPVEVRDSKESLAVMDAGSIAIEERVHEMAERNDSADSALESVISGPRLSMPPFADAELFSAKARPPPAPPASLPPRPSAPSVASEAGSTPGSLPPLSLPVGSLPPAGGGSEPPERRREQRQTRLALEVSVLSGMPRQTSKLYATDISREGAFLECVDPPERGTELRLSLAISSRRTLGVGALVVRTVDPEEARQRGVLPGAGLRFERLPAAAQALLDEALDHAAKLPESKGERPASLVVRRLIDTSDLPPQSAFERAETLKASATDAMAQGLYVRASSELQMARLYAPKDEAIRELSEQVGSRTNEVKAATAFRQGIYAEATGDSDEALRCFREAAALSPNNAACTRKAGEYSLDRGSVREARRYFAQALESKPDDPELHGLMARVHRLAGRNDLALARAQHAVKLAPDHPELRVLLENIEREINDERV